ncbi:hypothetical protein BY458DRAFT_491501 [Sporodiniella umbellata]|nr:hypothetical protein BY458DRAFT_491501 [Sporodiniella umbellata]
MKSLAVSKKHPSMLIILRFYCVFAPNSRGGRFDSIRQIIPFFILQLKRQRCAWQIVRLLEVFSKFLICQDSPKSNMFSVKREALKLRTRYRQGSFAFKQIDIRTNLKGQSGRKRLFYVVEESEHIASVLQIVLIAFASRADV